ncbi:MAG TPA: hemolysin family protein [Chthoniobacterales bacterium]|nr:hemolysin family protein [Chthoniobacterales bacterium]
MPLIALLVLVAAVATPATEWEPFGIVLFKLLTVAFLVLLNGFFVACEFAIVKVRPSQLDALIAGGIKPAKLARHIAARLDAYLSATQLGITLASLALGWLGEPFLARMLEPFFALAGVTSPAIIHTISFALAFAAITFLHIVLGELAPKSVAIRKATQTTLWVSRPLALFHTIFKPAIWLFNGAANLILRHVLHIDPVAETELAHSEEELRVILAESQKAQEVSTLEKEMLLNVFDLRRLAVRNIVTPRRSVVFLDVGDSLAENLRLAKSSGHTRFPLCRGHLDQSIGLIHIKDLLALEGDAISDLGSIKRELLSIPEMLSVPRLLNLFLNRHAHLALSLDEFGGATGIVTLDNVLEELVGEIRDEFDAQPREFHRLDENNFIVNGALALHELREIAGLDLKHADVSTAAGYVTAALGNLPKKGDQVTIDGYLVTVVQASTRRVRQLHFHKLKGTNNSRLTSSLRQLEL